METSDRSPDPLLDTRDIAIDPVRLSSLSISQLPIDLYPILTTHARDGYIERQITWYFFAIPSLHSHWHWTAWTAILAKPVTMGDDPLIRHS